MKSNVKKLIGKLSSSDFVKKSQKLFNKLEMGVFIYIFLCLILLMLLFLFNKEIRSILGYYRNTFTKSLLTEENITNSNNSPVSLRDEDVLRLTLIKKGEGDEVVLKEFDLDQRHYNDIVRWKDLLYYQDASHKKIISHNIQSGETSIVYDASTSGIKTELEYTHRDTEPKVGNLELINDSLFISITVPGEGFSTEGATFVIDLNSDTKARKVIDLPGEIIKFREYYLIERSVGGDVCGGGFTYALLDLNNMSAQIIADTVSGCRGGEVWVGTDDSDRMILANYSGHGPGPSEYVSSGSYDYIKAVSLADPPSREFLLSKENIPEGINEVEYIESINSIILLGKSAYLYDLSSDSIRTIVEFPDNWRDSFVRTIKDNSICITYSTDNISGNDKSEPPYKLHGAEVNIELNQLNLDSSVCSSHALYNESQPLDPLRELNDIKTKIKLLNLPDGYELISVRE